MIPLRFARHLVALAAVALVVAGCGSAAQLTDVRQIVTKSEDAMKAVRTVHFRATAIGRMTVGVDETAAPSGSAAPSASGGPSTTPAATPAATPTANATASASAAASASPAGTEPSGPASTSIPLDGSWAEGDADYGTSSATVTGQLPGLPNTAGQVIVVGADAYLRLNGETLYHHLDSSTLLFNPADPGGAPSILLGILAVAADPHLQPALVGTENCSEGRCYHISVAISKDVADQTIGSAGTALGQGQLDLWILTNDFRVAQLDFTSTDPAAGTVKARVELTRFNRGLEIAAPAPDQVAPEAQG